MQGNALKDFKAHYAQTTTDANALSDRVNGEMVAAYDAASNSIYKILTQARLNDSYATKKGQDLALSRIEDVIAKLKTKLTNTLRAGAYEMAGAMAEAAQRDLELLGVADEEMKKLFGPPSMDYINTTFQDSFAHVAARTDHMAQSVREDLRRDMAQIMRRASVEGLSRPQAYRVVRDKVLEHLTLEIV
ncbi:MAG: hypothetical protein H0S80_12855 [Desulfovibrionaceae bacterium]|nr:hypothetical protein [Desulfovibrionaceae bacterium]